MNLLGRAYAERDRTERAMCARMTVGANEQQPRQGQSEFRTDHVNDSLAAIVDIEALYAEAGGLFPQRTDRSRAPFGIARRAPWPRGDHMIDRGKRQLGIMDSGATLLELADRSDARQLMHQVPVHMQQADAAGQVGNHMRVPDLVEHGSCHDSSPWRFVPMTARAVRAFV